jgi:hypothetical protein
MGGGFNMEKTGYTEESPGVKSSTRLVFIIGCISVLIIAGYMVYTKSGNPIEIGTFLTMSIAALGGTKYLGTK